MVLFNYSTKEITAKIVYYGPGLCGKTTNLQFIYENLPKSINKGKMLSLATKTDRTLFFDFLPIDLGTIRGMRTRLQLYTVPGQVFYNTTRKLVLKGADGIVFVADSQKRMIDANLESFKNLEENLIEHGMSLSEIPLIIQFNKRDLPNALSLEQMNKELNRMNVPYYEAQAASGQGVFETLRGVSKLLLSKISRDVIDRDRGSLAGPPRVAGEEAKQSPAAARETPSAAEPASGRGKLMQFLKRGKTPETSAPEPAVEEPITPGAPFTPPPAMAPDETVLTQDDLIPLPTAGRPAPSLAPEPEIVRQPEPQIVRQPEPQIRRHEDSDGVFTAGEIERESEYSAGGRDLVASGSGETRQISVPIDLSSLPSNGRIRLVFEVRIEVEPNSGGAKSKKSSSGSTMMRDLEAIG